MNFSRIKKYSFTAQNIHKLMANECVEIRKEITKKKVIPSNKIINNDFFIPPEKDSLFWCWIIFNYGFSEYEILKEHVFTTEKEYKINFVDKVRKNKKLLKTMKVKIAQMEGHLANDSILSINYLEPMLNIDNYNFIYMSDKIYYEKIPHINKTCVIKYFIKEEKYGLFLEEELSSYKEKLFVVDSIIKPIKSISNYKVQELKDICKKLKIDIMKTPTKSKPKKILYQLIMEKII
jgi:hypothetical protein